MIANLEGQRDFEEHSFQGDPILTKGPINIGIGSDGNFNVEVPFGLISKRLENIPLVIDSKLRPTLAATWVDDKGDDGKSEYGLRLVFDIVDSKIEIVEGALGSTIERWNLSKIKITQPSDMGVITGTKG